MLKFLTFTRDHRVYWCHILEISDETLEWRWTASAVWNMYYQYSLFGDVENRFDISMYTSRVLCGFWYQTLSFVKTIFLCKKQYCVPKRIANPWVQWCCHDTINCVIFNVLKACQITTNPIVSASWFGWDLNFDK